MWSANRLLTLGLLAAVGVAAQEEGLPTTTVRINGLSPGIEPSEDLRVVLMDADGGDCQREIVRTDGARSIRLSGPCWRCGDPNNSRVRVGVMARGHSVAYLTGEQLCAREGSEVTVTLQPRTAVKVAVFAVTKDQLKRARDALINADWVLDRSRTGIELQATVEMVAPERLPRIDPDEDVLCNNGSSSESHRPGVINVFFGVGPNHACPSGDVVFIAQDAELRILAHELGHALALLSINDGEATYDQGHSNDRRSFDCANSMWVNSHLVADGFSVGQAFWIGVSKEPFAAKARADLLACRSQAGLGLCIPLALPRRDAPGEDRCKPCTFDQALGIDEAKTRSQAPRFRLRLREQPRLCSNLDKQTALEERFALLSEHSKRQTAAGILGSRNAAQFRERWIKGAVVAVVVEAIGSPGTTKQQREDGIKMLEKLRDKGWSKGSVYLTKSIKLLKDGKSPPSTCSTSK